jgi:uncharacterized lipoprotein YmbA
MLPRALWPILLALSLNGCTTTQPQIELYSGPFSTIDFSNSPAQLASSKYLNRQVMAGPNFAGRYHVAYMSCGSQCRDNLVVDLTTGAIIGEFQSCYKPDYHLDSIAIIAELTHPSGECLTQTFHIVDQRLQRAN